jgi:hypothetical protein
MPHESTLLFNPDSGLSFPDTRVWYPGKRAIAIQTVEPDIQSAISVAKI